MADINCVALTGRLTRDSELKYTQGGNAVVRFSLAVNRSKRNADGSWSDEPSYFDCIYFGKPAEAINSYLTKGRQIAINGELRQSRWESEGQTRSRVEIYVNNLTLLSSQNRNGELSADGVNNAPRQTTSYSQPQAGNNNYSKPQARAPQVPGPEDFQDDDIPF